MSRTGLALEFGGGGCRELTGAWRTSWCAAQSGRMLDRDVGIPGVDPRQQ